MGLESATYIGDLITTNPTSADFRSQGDDHLRLLKTVLKNSFPGLTAGPLIPSGTKMLFVQAAVPAGWTIDATHDDKVLRINDTEGGGTGGNWTFSGASMGGPSATGTVEGGGVAEVASESHTHPLINTSWRPAYVDAVIGTKD